MSERIALERRFTVRKHELQAALKQAFKDETLTVSTHDKNWKGEPLLNLRILGKGNNYVAELPIFEHEGGLNRPKMTLEQHFILYEATHNGFEAEKMISGTIKDVHIRQ